MHTSIIVSDYRPLWQEKTARFPTGKLSGDNIDNTPSGENYNGTILPGKPSGLPDDWLTTEPIVLPNAPSVLNVQNITSNSAELVWMSVDGVNGYRVYAGTQMVLDTNGLTTVVTGLQPETNYTYGVTAYNQTGESPKTTVNFTTQQLQQVLPGPPVVTVLEITDTSAKLSWQAVQDAEGYRIYKGTELLCQTASLSQKLSNLQPDTSYEVQVKTYNQVGESTGTNVQFKTLSINTTPTELNLDPLKIAGDTLTNKFPFSLPWDLKRGFELFSSDYITPKWTLEFTAPLLGHVQFVIDLSQFNDLASIARMLELIAFDIGLVLITRKLMGGSV